MNQSPWSIGNAPESFYFSPPPPSSLKQRFMQALIPQAFPESSYYPPRPLTQREKLVQVLMPQTFPEYLLYNWTLGGEFTPRLQSKGIGDMLKTQIGLMVAKGLGLDQRNQEPGVMNTIRKPLQTMTRILLTDMFLR